MSSESVAVVLTKFAALCTGTVILSRLQQRGIGSFVRRGLSESNDIGMSADTQPPGLPKYLDEESEKNDDVFDNRRKLSTVDSVSAEGAIECEMKNGNTDNLTAEKISVVIERESKIQPQKAAQTHSVQLTDTNEPVQDNTVVNVQPTASAAEVSPNKENTDHTNHREFAQGGVLGDLNAFADPSSNAQSCEPEISTTVPNQPASNTNGSNIPEVEAKNVIIEDENTEEKSNIDSSQSQHVDDNFESVSLETDFPNDHKEESLHSSETNDTGRVATSQSERVYRQSDIPEYLDEEPEKIAVSGNHDKLSKDDLVGETATEREINDENKVDLSAEKTSIGIETDSEIQQEKADLTHSVQLATSAELSQSQDNARNVEAPPTQPTAGVEEVNLSPNKENQTDKNDQESTQMPMSADPNEFTETLPNDNPCKPEINTTVPNQQTPNAEGANFLEADVTKVTGTNKRTAEKEDIKYSQPQHADDIFETVSVESDLGNNHEEESLNASEKSTHTCEVSSQLEVCHGRDTTVSMTKENNTGAHVLSDNNSRNATTEQTRLIGNSESDELHALRHDIDKTPLFESMGEPAKTQHSNVEKVIIGSPTIKEILECEGFVHEDDVASKKISGTNSNEKQMSPAGAARKVAEASTYEGSITAEKQDEFHNPTARIDHVENKKVRENVEDTRCSKIAVENTEERGLNRVIEQIVKSASTDGVISSKQNPPPSAPSIVVGNTVPNNEHEEGRSFSKEGSSIHDNKKDEIQINEEVHESALGNRLGLIEQYMAERSGEESSGSSSDTDSSYSSNCSACQADLRKTIQERYKKSRKAKADESTSSSKSSDSSDSGSNSTIDNDQMNADSPNSLPGENPSGIAVRFKLNQLSAQDKNQLPRSPWPGKRNFSDPFDNKDFGKHNDDNANDTINTATSPSGTNDTKKQKTAIIPSESQDSPVTTGSKVTFTNGDGQQSPSKIPSKASGPYIVDYNSSAATAREAQVGTLAVRISFDSSSAFTSLSTDSLGNVDIFVSKYEGLVKMKLEKVYIKFNILNEKMRPTPYRGKLGVGTIVGQAVVWDKALTIKNVPVSTLKDGKLKASVMRRETFGDKCLATSQVDLNKQHRFGPDSRDVVTTADWLALKHRCVEGRLAVH